MAIPQGAYPVGFALAQNSLMSRLLLESSGPRKVSTRLQKSTGSETPLRSSLSFTKKHSVLF